MKKGSRCSNNEPPSVNLYRAQIVPAFAGAVKDFARLFFGLLANFESVTAMNDSTFCPDSTEFDRQVKSFSKVTKKKNPLANLWFFDSPKNDTRLSLTTDPLFMHVVLLEGDVNVTGYTVNDGAVDRNALSPSLRIYHQDRHVEWWLVQWSNSGRGAKAEAAAQRHAAMSESAKATGATFHIKTEKDLRGKEILFDNWLNLCAAMTRCRSMSTALEAVALKDAFVAEVSLRYADLVALPNVDPAHMLALVAHALQSGSLRADLENELFGPQTVLTRAYV